MTSVKNGMTAPPFFIIGCGRSGTTSLCRILNEATNAECLVEPSPNLNVEARKWSEGYLSNALEVVTEAIRPRMEGVVQKGKIYGEKNNTLGPFIPYLYEAFKGRIVFIYRDGRHVVRSLMNWHNQMFGSIYRECKEVVSLSPRAFEAVRNLPIEIDASDYNRPRPLPGDLWFDRWEDLSRLEMCAYYWSRSNEQILDQLAKIPRDQWISIDYTSPSAEAVLKIANFLGLEDLSSEKIDALLNQKLNSLEQRTGETSAFPNYQSWSKDDRIRFDNVAGRTMYRLGFYGDAEIRYKPANYGQWWKQYQGGLDWYTWMYNGRLSAHQSLSDFIKEQDQGSHPIHSMLDVGCGYAVGYPDVYPERRYVGMDLAEHAIQWCREYRKNPKHDYLQGDVLVNPPDEKFDLVFSQGTIDNVYDINAFLNALVEASQGWIYLTASRGWFPELKEHRYSWDESTTCMYNDISPSEVRAILEGLGCTDIQVEPLPMKDAAVEFETLIIARVKA